MARLWRSLVLAGWWLAASTGGASPPPADPFDTLAAAYVVRDARGAAAAYADDGHLAYRYAGAPAEDHRGREAIAGAFQAFFDSLPDGSPLRLEFRFQRRDARQAAGVYRMVVGDSTYHGRFTVYFAGDGRFASDTSTDATAAEFDALEPGNPG